MIDQYICAVARIRVKETELMNDNDIMRMNEMNDMDECMDFVRGKWRCKGDTVAALINERNNQILQLSMELAPNENVFDIFMIPNDYNNLKTAIKSMLTDTDANEVFLRPCTINPLTIIKAVRERKFCLLPEHMQLAAQQARLVFIETSNGCLCDMIADRAALECIYQIGQASHNDLVKKYVEMFVALTNIKIAIRSCIMGRDFDAIERSLVLCESLNKHTLAVAASKNVDAIYEYLRYSSYKKAIPYMRESMVSFEKWCDDCMIEYIRSQRSNSFTVSPIFAYILACQIEVKAVRMVLIAKQNRIDAAIMRERLRKMYV